MYIGPSCHHCRSSHIRCDGRRPCDNCVKRGKECFDYDKTLLYQQHVLDLLNISNHTNSINTVGDDVVVMPNQSASNLNNLNIGHSLMSMPKEQLSSLLMTINQRLLSNTPKNSGNIVPSVMEDVSHDGDEDEAQEYLSNKRTLTEVDADSEDDKQRIQRRIFEEVDTNVMFGSDSGDQASSVGHSVMTSYHQNSDLNGSNNSQMNANSNQYFTSLLQSHLSSLLDMYDEDGCSSASVSDDALTIQGLKNESPLDGPINDNKNGGSTSGVNGEKSSSTVAEAAYLKRELSEYRALVMNTRSELIRLQNENALLKQRLNQLEGSGVSDNSMDRGLHMWDLPNELYKPVFVVNMSNFRIMGCNNYFRTLSRYSLSDFKDTPFSVFQLLPSRSIPIWRLVIQWLGSSAKVKYLENTGFIVTGDQQEICLRLKRRFEEGYCWVECEPTPMYTDEFKVDDIYIPSTMQIPCDISLMKPIHQPPPSHNYQKLLDILFQRKVSQPTIIDHTTQQIQAPDVQQQGGVLTQQSLFKPIQLDPNEAEELLSRYSNVK